MRKDVQCLLSGFLFIGALTVSWAQEREGSEIEYKAKVLHTASFDLDSDSLVLYSKDLVDLYFLQSDVSQLIRRYWDIKNSHDLLTEMKARRVYQINDTMFSASNPDSSSVHSPLNYNGRVPSRNEIMEDIGFSLIYEGKCMILLKEGNRIIRKGVRARRVNGMLGNKWFVFRLPDGREFYGRSIALGE